MILVDTSVWRVAARRSRPAGAIDADRWDEAQGLPLLLDSARVSGQPWVYAELLLGGLAPSAADRYRKLPWCLPLGNGELVAWVERFRPSGVGLVDVALLGAATRAGLRLWTLDAGLRRCASEAGVLYGP